MFHLFAIPLSQCAPAGSAEWSTNTLLVTWLAHNKLIALPASPYKLFYSGFHTLLHFRQFFNVWVCICLSLYMSLHVYSCFHSFTIFPSQCAPIWLSRAIYQHSFSHLGSAQISDCITCFTSKIFLFLFPQDNCLFACSFMPLFYYTSMFHSSAIFPSKCAPISSTELSTSLSNRPHFCPAPYLHLKTPGTSFGLTSNTMLRFWLTLR